jgi:hypothetical protein
MLGWLSDAADFAEGLHRDDAVETDVAGPVDLGHAAAPDDPVELVPAAE